jgi:hypothetical protein
MNHGNGLVFQCVVLTILFLAAKTVSACVCAAADYTVLGKFEHARFVVIAKVIAVDKTSSPERTRTKMPPLFTTITIVGAQHERPSKIIFFRHAHCRVVTLLVR